MRTFAYASGPAYGLLLDAASPGWARKESGERSAHKGVLDSTDGRSRRLRAPVRRDDITVDGDGWTVKAAPGWVVREGARRGDYELVRQQP